MAFVKSTEKKNNLLTFEDLETSSVVNKICYVLNYTSGVSTLEKGFYKLYLKSSDDVIITAMIFDIKDFINSGFDIARLKNKFIKISGTVNSDFSNNSIILSSIEEVDIDFEDRAKFVGEVENLDELYSEIREMLSSIDSSYSLPAIYKNKNYSNIMGGKKGGYVKFVWKWLMNITLYSDICEDSSLLMSSTYRCILNYAKYLERVDLHPLISNKDKMDILREISIDDTESSMIACDAMSSILGVSTPEHLYSYIIFNTFNLVVQMSEISDAWKGLPVGGVKLLKGNTKLVKY